MLMLYVTYLIGGYGWTKALSIAGNMYLPKTALPQILRMVVLVEWNTSAAPLIAKFQGKIMVPLMIFIDCTDRFCVLRDGSRTVATSKMERFVIIFNG